MKTGFLKIALAMSLLTAALPAIAATYPVDDSASQVLDSTLRMRWDSVTPQPGAQTGVTGITTVLVRLDVAPWKGRQGRIYLVLPAQPAGAISASWTARGPLLPGALRSGERTLVYAGVLESERIEDTLRLVIQADGRKLVRSEQLRFSFEIDLELP